MKKSISKVLALALALITICIPLHGGAEEYEHFWHFFGDNLVIKDGYNAKILWAYNFLAKGDYEQAYALVENVIEHADEVREDTDTSWYTFSLKEAYYLAAACTRFGDGTEVDYEKSGEYLTKAAELGHQDAQVWLGSAYRFGAYGFEKDSKKAAEWYQKAVDQGDQDLIQLMDCYVCMNSYDHALISLAACYIYGEGVEEDLETAKKLLKTAADLGNLTACYELGGIYLEKYVDGDGTKDDAKYAFRWLQKGAKTKNTATYAPALLLLGYCYRNGIGTSKDINQGYKYYQKALEYAQAAGDNDTCAQAYYYIALHYANKRDNTKEKSEKWNEYQKLYQDYIYEASLMNQEDAQQLYKEFAVAHTKEQMQKVFTKAFEDGTPNNGLCGATVSLQLQAIGIIDSYLSANGNKYFKLFKDNEKLANGYTVKKYSKDQKKLSDLINSVNKENISGENTYIALCFKIGGDRGDSQAHGHVLLIHKIYDGKVYFVENWSDKDNPTAHGYMRCYSINAFLASSGFGYSEMHTSDGYTLYEYDGAIRFMNPD